MTDTRTIFANQNPGIVEFLTENSRWSSFLADMLTTIDRKGSLTDNQLRAVLNTQAKVAATRVAKETRVTPVDLSPIHAMFDKAKAAGLNKLAYRAEGLVLTLAKSNSANPGAIYVKRTDGTYVGKVLEQTFQAVREATGEDKAALKVIAANPADAATRYGRKTGTCSCCGRELTDPVSIEAGIGPVCAEKWGF